MKMHKFIIGLALSLLLVVLCELALLYFLSRKISMGTFIKKDIKKVNAVKQNTACETEENLSCANWFARYTHIESSETLTKGSFSQLWESQSTKESRIMLMSGTSNYYVSFMRDVTVLKIQDSSGKILKQSSLKEGDSLKIIEKYQKQNGNSEQFSVTIIREK